MAPQSQTTSQADLKPLDALTTAVVPWVRGGCQDDAHLIRLTSKTVINDGSTTLSSLEPVSNVNSDCFPPNFVYVESFLPYVRSYYYSPAICPYSYTIARSYTSAAVGKDIVAHFVPPDEKWAQCCPEGYEVGANECRSKDSKGGIVAPINIRWNTLTDIIETLTFTGEASTFKQTFMTTATKATGIPTGVIDAEGGVVTGGAPSEGRGGGGGDGGEGGDGALNGGEIAGITIGIAAALALVGYIIFKIHQSHIKHEARKREIGARVVPTHRDHTEPAAAGIQPPDYSFRPRNGEIRMEDLLAMSREIPDPDRDRDSGIGDIERPRMRGGVFVAHDPAPEYSESVENLPGRGGGGLASGLGSGTNTPTLLRPPVIPNEPAPGYTESVEHLPGRNISGGETLAPPVDMPSQLTAPLSADLPSRG